MSRTKTVKNQDKFQMAVNYLTEYSGVRGAVIADPEGLVISRSGGEKFNAELYCALAREIASSMNKLLPELITPGIEYMAIKTSQDWLTVARSESFLLVVAAERNADELLNVRIGRALEMISSNLKNKYRAVYSHGSSGIKTKNMEAAHV
jgi:predicted regulator of Ras-like GTPase activity (Roadblock/LC7/MglB family)